MILIQHLYRETIDVRQPAARQTCIVRHVKISFLLLPPRCLLMWSEKLWQVTVTPIELPLCVANKLQLYMQQIKESQAASLSPSVAATPQGSFRNDLWGMGFSWHYTSIHLVRNKTNTGTDMSLILIEWSIFQNELSRHIYWANNITQTQCMTIVNKKTEKGISSYGAKTVPSCVKS